MYIDKDKAGRYSLQDMSEDDVRGLAEMIRGASIIERRAFFLVLEQIRKLGLL